jgi:hypothetical protein
MRSEFHSGFEIHPLQVVVIRVTITERGPFGSFKEMLVRPLDDRVFVRTAPGQIDANQDAVSGDVLGRHILEPDSVRFS